MGHKIWQRWLFVEISHPTKNAFKRDFALGIVGLFRSLDFIFSRSHSDTTFARPNLRLNNW